MSHYTRRHFLSQQAFGLGGLALSWLLQQDAAASPAKPELEKRTFDVKPRRPAARRKPPR